MVVGNAESLLEVGDSNRARCRTGALTLREIASLRRVRKDKVIAVRQQLATGTYDLDKRLDVVVERLLMEVAGEHTVNDNKADISLPNRRTRIAVVDDHPAILEGLEQLINQENDLLVCVKAGNKKEALDAIKRQEVDLVIVDMLLKNTTGVKVTEKLRSRYPSLHILILSMSDDQHHVKGAFQAGARGYITKDEVSARIITGIRQVLTGGIYVSKKLARKFSRRTIVGWISEAEAEDSLGEV